MGLFCLAPPNRGQLGPPPCMPEKWLLGTPLVPERGQRSFAPKKAKKRMGKPWLPALSRGT